MADDLSLLFRLKGENSQLKAVLADSTAATKSAVAQLRQSFGPQLTQTVTVASKSFSDLGDNLSNFVAQRVPLVGGAIVRVTDALRGASKEAPKTEKAIASVAKSIQSIATESGKSVPQIASFLTRFIQIEGQAKRDQAAVDFFGASLSAKLIPQLEQTGTALAGVAGEGATAGSSIAAMAGPIGIAVLALAALAAGAVVAAKELFDLSKRTAEFQGHMFDLAQQTGIAVETLSAFEVLSRTTGGNLASITQALVLFQRKLDEAQDPLSKTAEQFRKFNIDTTDTENSLRSAFNALAAMPEGFAQTNAAAELFGARGGKQVLAILKESGGDLDAVIKRLRDLGILISDDAARAADKFNDELELLNFEMRALGAAAAEDLIPALTEIIRSLGEMVTAMRPLISLFGTLAGTAIRPVVAGFKGLSIIVQALTRDYEGLARSIKEAREQQEIFPLKTPEVTPVPLPGAPTGQQTASEAVNQADAVLAAVKRKAAEQNQALDALFQQGRINRQRQALETIAENKQVLKADQDRIDALLAQKEQEIKALDEAQRNRGEVVNRDTEQYRAITAQIVKLQQERLDKENEFEVSSRAIRAKAAKERADATRNQLANERDLLLGEFDRTIKDIEAQIARGAKAEEDGLTIIEQLEKAKIDARLESLQKQKDIGFLTIQDQTDLDAELQKLQQERDRLDDEQQARRLQRERDTAERTREILLSSIDTLLELEQIVGERRIATIQALADQRVITEEDAAKRILQIRLNLLDDEIEATSAKLEAAKSIADKDERIRAQADLNNQLKILKEQRVTIETDGNRAIDDARQQDILNERRYAAELEDIRERIRDIERDTAQEKIRLMILNFASRKDVLKAQLKEDLKEEDERHRRKKEIISQEKQETEERINVLEGYLKNLKATTKEEIEERAKLIESLEQLRIKRDELNAQEKAEDTRHKTRTQRKTEEAQREIDLAGPGGGILEGLQSGQLATAAEGIKSFSEVARVALSAVGVAFNQLGQAAGEAVRAFVLFGSAGGGFRKFAAELIASIAQMAVVQSVWELAQGFAMLALTWFTNNPKYAKSASAHFIAAATYGAIGGVAALAGRSVAGGLFQSQGGGGAGADSSQGGPQQLNPLTLGRNQPQAPQMQTQVIRHEHVFRIESNDSHIVKVVSKNINNNGELRQFILNDALL